MKVFCMFGPSVRLLQNATSVGVHGIIMHKCAGLPLVPRLMMLPMSPRPTSLAARVAMSPIPAGHTADDAAATPLCTGVPGVLGSETHWLSPRPSAQGWSGSAKERGLGGGDCGPIEWMVK